MRGTPAVLATRVPGRSLLCHRLGLDFVSLVLEDPPVILLKMVITKDHGLTPAIIVLLPDHFLLAMTAGSLLVIIITVVRRDDGRVSTGEDFRATRNLALYYAAVPVHLIELLRVAPTTVPYILCQQKDHSLSSLSPQNTGSEVNKSIVPQTIGLC